MGVIKINNIIYGSNLASDIIYKNTTVEEKLNAIPVFDPSDNINIEHAKYDYLTYGHIINHLESDAADKVLSAKQGKELKNYIDNIDLSYLENDISNNAEDIELLNSNLEKLSNKVNILEQEMTDNEAITDLDNRVAKNTTDIAHLSGNTVFYNSEKDSFDVYSNGVLIGSVATGIKDPVKLTPILTQDNGKAICSGVWENSPGFSAWTAFDGITNNHNTGWVGTSNKVAGQWLGYNFDKLVTIRKFKITNRYTGSNQAGAPNSFKLQGSNNGTDWYDIQQYTNTNSAYGASSWFYVDTPQTFEMFRLYILSGHFANYVMINELEFYGN